MRTIAFHSHKGGCGRTLALANCAKILNEHLGYKVLMVDYDLDSPGLPYKFDVQSKVRMGYLDYLFGTTAEQRSEGRNKKDRIDLLKYASIAISDGLNLLPIGNPENNLFWYHLSSEKFYNLFKFVDFENVKNGDRQSKNWNAFLKDKEDFSEAFDRPDLCLIDCRAAHESVSVPLLAWADVILEFVPCNHEGVLGALIVKHMLSSNSLCRTEKEFHPIISRIPQDADLGEIKQALGGIKASFSDAGFSNINIDWEDAFVIHEQRILETQERTLFRNPDNISEYKISFDYWELCKLLIKNIERRGVDDKFDATKMRLDRYFAQCEYSGEMYNTDNERNVALRTKTLVDLMEALSNNNFYQSLGLDDKAQKRRENEAVFFQAGKDAGTGFGIEVRKGKFWEAGREPDTNQERIENWLAFDRNAGFGNWTLGKDPPKEGRSIIHVGNHFLQGSTFGINFIAGYIEGVLTNIIGDFQKGTFADVEAGVGEVNEITFVIKGVE